ncbi:MAG: hypothetical protein IRY96_03680 [Burkholderiales bacterium]|nr:hypothetical protein [Burkholderiales bacterium]
MASVAEARALAEALRELWPEKAAEIDRAIAGAQCDAVPVSVSISYRLEKFDGDYEPGKAPIEIIEGKG